MRGPAVRELPLIPEAWHDRAGSIGAVMNRDPGMPRLHEAAVSPNEPPRLDQYLARYQDYTSLREWELLTGGLHKEQLPARRNHLGEYRQVTELNLGPQYGQGTSFPFVPTPPRAMNQGEPKMSADFFVVHAERPPCDADALQQPSLPPPQAAWHGLSASPACQAEAEAPTASQCGAFLPVSEVLGGSARLLQPVAPASSSSSPRHAPMVGGLRGHGLACRSSPRQHRPTDHPAPGGFGLPEARAAPEVNPRIRTVHASDTGRAGGIDGMGSATKAKIVDKDRSHYPSAKDMRPARRINGESKRRLNELLKLPEARIEAADTHPSRKFQTVPTENLRVA